MSIAVGIVPRSIAKNRKQSGAARLRWLVRNEMYSSSRNCPTLSHLVNLSPAGAANAFDVMILDPALAAWLIPAGALVKARPVRYDALRVLPAALFVGRRRQATMSVILELLPWSDHRSELALRSTERSWLPICRGVADYRAAGAGALEVLARLLEARSVAPHRRVGVPVGNR